MAKKIMELDFILYEMTALRYFIPIVIEAKKIDIGCNFFCNWNAKKKYTNLKKYRKELNQIAKTYNIQLFFLNEISNRNFPIITIEDVGLDDLEVTSKRQKLFSLYYSGDFIRLYKKYVDKVDHCFLISEFFANYYDCLSSKNLYFGSPKFDIKLDKKLIYKKYNLNAENNYALVFFPRIRDRNKININRIYSVLRELNLKIIVKTRGKDPILYPTNKGDFCFVDDSWFPHISLELIEISNVVINFGSAAIEECVMLDTPIIDFNIKPFDKIFKTLYEFDFAMNFESTFSKIDLRNAIDFLLKNNLSDEFAKARKKQLFSKKNNFSSKFIDFLVA
jgi:hypothetical protein